MAKTTWADAKPGYPLYLKKYYIKVFRRRNGDWSWVMWSKRNGKKVAWCGEDYRNRLHVKAMVFELFGVIV